MIFADINNNSIKSLIAKNGIRLRIGPFNVCLKSSISNVCEHLRTLYCDFELFDEGEFTDFHVSIDPPSNLRRFVHKQAIFSFDDFHPFLPLPFSQAGAMFEWGLNWCIANQSHQYLIIHAAAVEKNGYGIILPGIPGSGKSTLCAALVCHGWRLLSDEMALLSLQDGNIIPIPRPISLKNRSIDIIRNFSAKAVIDSIVPGTIKGTLGHMRPFQDCISRVNVPAVPSKIIFPKYLDGSNTELSSISKCHSFMKVAENSFNYNVLGVGGFNAISKLVSDCEVYDFKYQSLIEAIKFFDRFDL